jgi:epoxide hydrolase-like predicted phosphatase
MLLLKNTIPNYYNIKNIIFDFGGVICDIDIDKTVEKFNLFGPGKEENIKVTEGPSSAFEELVAKYETGLVSSSEFRESIRNYYVSSPDDQSIDDAWNALLTGIPEKRIRLLEQLKNKYRLFLLSNTNEIHYHCYLGEFRKKYGYSNFEEIFEKVYFSYRIHIRKPDPGIYKFVLSDSDLVPSETLFIDDMLVNVEAAISLGINGFHLKEGEDLADLFILPQ